MSPEPFRDQHALLEYVEEHDLAYSWASLFSYRLRSKYRLMASTTRAFTDI